MVEKIALKLANQMEMQRMINNEDKDYYEYALVTLMEHIIIIGTLLLIGVFLKQLVATICFLVFFLSLRKRTGGYHADKFWQCYLLTIMAYLLAIQLAVVLSQKPIIMYIMLSLAILVVGIIGTVNHPNMDMNLDELHESKRAARLLVVLEALIIVGLIAFRVNILYVSCMVLAIILCAFLLCLAKIVGQEVKTR